MNAKTLPPLPEPTQGLGSHRWAYSADDMLAYAATAIAAELEALRAENAKLKTVMIAAAEELQAHWDAHCDAEGYGPASLMRRLEEGIPSEYGYTAGAFAELRAQAEALRTALLDIDQCAQRRGDKYLCDCIDNGGAPYQSQWLADLLAAARAGGGNA